MSKWIIDGERLTEARAEQISEEIMQAVYKHYGMKFVPRKLQRHQFEQEKDITTWKVFGEIKLELDDEIICEDVDLDQEIVIVDRERLTEARAEQISEEIMEAVYNHKGMKFEPRQLRTK